jgi:hypothetical protein
MEIGNSVKMFNTACNIMATMKQRDISAEEMDNLIAYLGIVKDCEFPKQEESPIITPTARETEEVIKNAQS